MGGVPGKEKDHVTRMSSFKTEGGGDEITPSEREKKGMMMKLGNMMSEKMRSGSKNLSKSGLKGQRKAKSPVPVESPTLPGEMSPPPSKDESNVAALKGTARLRQNIKPSASRVRGKRESELDNELLKDVGADPDFFESEGARGVTVREERFLSECLQKHFLFMGLSDKDRTQVIKFMEKQSCEDGDVIFQQNDPGDSCYIIEKGIFNVNVDGKPVKDMQARETFGELAMLYGVKRTASLQCKKKGVIWKMSDVGFRNCMRILTSAHESKIRAFIKTNENLKVLKEDQRTKLAAACTVQKFIHEDKIIRTGDPGEWMFMTMEGNVVETGPGGKSIQHHAGELLGLAGFMAGTHQVDFKAIRQVTCLALGKHALQDLDEPIKVVLRRAGLRGVLANTTTFFGDLTNMQQRKLVANFKDVVLQKDDIVLKQGEGAKLVVVVEGSVASDDEASPHFIPGMCIGEEQMLKKGQIDKTYRARGPTRIFYMTNEMVMITLNADLEDVMRQNNIAKVLNSMVLFRNLSLDLLDSVMKRLEQQTFHDGQVIVREGDAAQNFYLVQSGTINVYKNSDEPSAKNGCKHIRTLSKWDYFGERGLLQDENRTATCTANGECICLVLSADVFSCVLGSFKDEIVHRINLQDTDVMLEDLYATHVVGEGSFGTVKKVHPRKRDESGKNDARVYALKALLKNHVVEQHNQKALENERAINAQCYHPCIMQFIKTMQDAESVYFLTEFLGGGDLFFAIREIGMLTKKQSQFFISSITLALEYLHERDIIYRDLKPENVILDFNGYAKLVDFGCCKQAKRTYTLLGTPQYMSPEVIKGKGYGCNTDWWSLGVMMYEFVVGPLPFTGSGGEDDQLEIFRQILQAPLTFPSYVKDEAAIAVMSGLMERIPELRMCATSKGIQELQEHAYFSGFDWDGIAGTYMDPPWKPNVKRIKENWEAADCDHLSDSSVIVDDPEMEWAKDF
eukprot:gnl/MRDRNA2_/MRDRNA2_83579_c0_seq4.p1 gnl/MRDRNA2_/MRDRNA2_83579_c0~~gnl/MRDRNA2_/MRDRNA2_83579_c0_seq4.p1  ORF type:complete len:965 (-),score=184.82 gnl/MRDRNA2_/MRDRNA2_83579_c0_seq4:24-2918(-)